MKITVKFVPSAIQLIVYQVSHYYLTNHSILITQSNGGSIVI